jgi:hypothetical protein
MLRVRRLIWIVSFTHLRPWRTPAKRWTILLARHAVRAALLAAPGRRPVSHLGDEPDAEQAHLLAVKVDLHATR